MKVVILGSGNVATHLGHALKGAKHQVIQVFSRSESSARVLAKELSCDFTTDLKKITDKADVYIVAVSDSAIKKVLSEIGNRKSEIGNSLIVHTSGSVALKVFEKKFKNFGVLYPVQTFSKNHPVDFQNIPVCIEANNPFSQKQLKLLARSISGEIHFINSDQRKRVHLAAVFANNFSNHLFAIAEQLLKKENIPFDLLRPLILETALKVQNASPLEMQTGPAKRGDVAVIEDHLKMLSKKKEFKGIYKLISESIEEMSGLRL